MHSDDNRIFGVPRFVKFFIAAAGVIAGMIITRLFFIMPYIVQDESMKPALQKGDYILLLKPGSKSAGDIVLAMSPVEQDRFVLKRIVSAQGRIEIKNKKIYINNKEYENKFSVIKDRRVFPEYFSNRDNMKIITVGKGEFFLLGDNLDYSMDSRQFGPVRQEKIIGKMIYKF